MMKAANQSAQQGKSKNTEPRQVRPTIQITRQVNSRILQGDFYRDIRLIESLAETPDEVILEEITYPLSVLLTQDCDLESDNRSRTHNASAGEKQNHDKEIVWLMFAPVYVFGHFLTGQHLAKMGLTMSRVEDKTLINKIQQNDIPRFHFLKFVAAERLPDMIIDFKHFFTVPTKVFHQKETPKFDFRAEVLFREAISQRFAYYLSRIGLPEIKP